MPLTPRQQRFVEEYLIDLNATAAARRAGYSEQTANQQGPRLLVNVGVAAAIAERQTAMSEQAGLTREWVLNGLRGEAQLRGEGSSHSARVRAYELLGKHLGMFEDRLTVETDARQVTEVIVTTREEARAVLALNQKAG